MDTLTAKKVANRVRACASRWRIRDASRCGVAAWAALLALGCGSQSDQLSHDPRVKAVAPADLSASPVVRASENGLEVVWWVVTSNQAAITAAMAPYLNRPVPLDEQTRALWEANGLRIVSVPVARLDELRQSMAIVGAIQRQWLGQTPMWTDTVNGPAWSGNRALALDSGRLSLGAGRLRLLTRCWTVPVPVLPQEADPSPAAALHIELLPQHLEARAGEGGARGIVGQPLMPLTAASDTSDPLAEGLVFRRLLVEMTVPQGDAYIIIPQHAGADWTVAPEGAEGVDGQSPREGATTGAGEPAASDGGAKNPADKPDEKKAEQPTTPAASPHVPGIGRVARDTGEATSPPANPPADEEALLTHGPPEIPAISLGEALLTSNGARDPTTVVPDPGTKGVWRADRSARAILVFIPRVPDRFRLIGR